MKEYFKTFAIILVLSYVFVFFGGYLLFDFSRNFYLALGTCALVFSAFVYALVRLSDRIKILEDKLKTFEKKEEDA